MRAIKCILSGLLLSFAVHAQPDTTTIKQYIRAQATALCADNMRGRGYVQEGRMFASFYLQEKFREMGLQPAPGAQGFNQVYFFPVNAFPGRMKLVINGVELKPGADYLVDAASHSLTVRSKKVKTIDMSEVKDLPALKKVLGAFDGENAYVLTGTDSMCKALGIRVEELAGVLPAGCYIVPYKTKLTWDVSRTQGAATVFYVKTDALPATIDDVSADVLAVLMPKSRNENAIAVAPGAVKDTFIAITAHFDHLGMMGSAAMFPGASDNASGTAMLLYLASYFVAHPPRYSILFIAFSGEEPGLLGSEYYVANPVVPLANIKFLINIDIMGDATDGVTVVNATEFPKQFSLLQEINDYAHYIPVIKSRGKAKNSDHYYFTEAGVPSFFMYSNGGKGYYHDVFDTAPELTLNHVGGVAELLIDFVGRMGRGR